MRLSKLFGRTSHQLPKENFELGQRFLIQGGGAYFFEGDVFLLPIGVRVWHNMCAFLKSELADFEIQETSFGLPLGKEGGDENTKALTETELKSLLPYVLQRHISSYRDLPVKLAMSNIITKQSTPFFNSDNSYSYLIVLAEEDKDSQKDFQQELKNRFLEIVQKIDLVDEELYYEEQSSDVINILAGTKQGENRYFHCKKCGYTATQELAKSISPSFPQEEQKKPIQKIHGPDLISVEELADFADISVHKTTKTLVFESSNAERIVVAMVRGDYDISEEKLKRAAGVEDLYLASSFTIREVFGTEVGYTGVVDLPEEVELIADLSTKGRINFECGANETDYHFLNVNFGRDLPEPENFYDIREVEEGETCANCKEGELGLVTGSEIANFNNFSVKLSQNDLAFTGKDGEIHKPEISLINLFTSTIFALILENHHDENGLIWPKEITPFKIHLIPLGSKKGIKEEAKKIYEKLKKAGISVLWDDRDEKAGVKFNDADLLGIPIHLIIGEKSYQKECIEWKKRESNETSFVKTDNLVKKIKDFYNS